MTTQQKIDYIREGLLKTDRDAEPTPLRVNLETPFNLVGQFTSTTAAAVMARNAEVRPERPASAPTNVSGQFDARAMWRNKAVNAQYLPARDDFSDDRSNGATDGDDTTEHSNLGMAHDLISCEINGESGPGCGHNGVDHIQRAIDCLTNYSKDQAMRDKNRADAARMHSIRFSS